MTISWISTGDLSKVGYVTERAVRKAVFRTVISPEYLWRGARLIVSAVQGRGGRAGQSYLIRLDSLPVELQDRWKAAMAPSVRPSASGPAAQADREWWGVVLAPAIGTEKHSRERGEAIRKIAAVDHVHPNGQRRRLSERTIQRRLDLYEDEGTAGLSRPKRADAGTSKVVVSARWDAFAPFDPNTKERIADTLRTHVRGLIRGGESGQMLKLLAEQRLRALTVAAGVPADALGLPEACVLPTGFLQREKAYRKLHQFETDRKAFEDARPRIRRHREGVMPMHVVVGDVHPVDVCCRRLDGSTATPRAIAWLDVATNRIWTDFVLLRPGEGIRNAHVIASFIRMADAWGMPTHLYLDNGSEYRWAEFVDDALKLVGREGCPLKLVDQNVTNVRSHIVRARAYNAAAKPIEGIFAVLERKYFKSIPGWIGGERMRKKTANVGREPEPFPGTFDQLQVLLSDAVDLYHRVPQVGGILAGKSPFDALADWVDRGWSRTAVDADAFRIAFSTRKRLTIRQGAVRHANRLWTCPELHACLDGSVDALIPKYEGWDRLPLLRHDGTLLGVAEPETSFGFLDKAGAREGRTREAAHRAAVKGLAKSAPKVDVLKERMELKASLPEPVEAPVGSRVSTTDQVKQIIAAINMTPAEKAEREREESDRRHMAKVESDSLFLQKYFKGKEELKNKGKDVQ